MFHLSIIAPAVRTALKITGRAMRPAAVMPLFGFLPLYLNTVRRSVLQRINSPFLKTNALHVFFFSGNFICSLQSVHVSPSLDI